MVTNPIHSYALGFWDGALRVYKMAVYVALMLLALTIMGTTPTYAQSTIRYKVVDLGLPPGYSGSYAYSINNKGEVVGFLYGNSLASTVTRPFFWRNGVMQVLEPPTGFQGEGWAEGINDRSEVVGTMRSVSTPTGQYTEAGFMWDASRGMRTIQVNLPAVEGTSLKAINNNGVIWGSVSQPSNIFQPRTSVYYATGKWSFGGGAEGGLNNQGLIGTSTILLDTATGIVTQLSPYSGARPVSDINDHGQLVLHSGPTGFTLFDFFAPGKPIKDVYPPIGSKFRSASPIAINNSAEVVGLGVLNSNNRSIFLYRNGEIIDINDFISPEDRANWQPFEEVKDINDHGTIVGVGTYKGTTRAFLLLREEDGRTILGEESLNLIADEDGDAGPMPPRLVSGIVCDNLPDMSPGLKNRLELRLNGIEDATEVSWSVTRDGASGSNAGYVQAEGGRYFYYPPDEYNRNPAPQSALTDITKEAYGTVNLTVNFQRNDRLPYQIRKPIYITRPPMVLVHGINSGPDAWKTFMTDVQNENGIKVPMVRVNHQDLDNGNGPVERGAERLREAIFSTLTHLRTGTPIPSSFQGESLIDFPFYKGKTFSARRTDVVAWSYGGVITRWYLASQGPGSISAMSTTWYRLNNASAPEQPLNYAVDQNIRKVITLGSMWRGVPLCNYANEARATGGTVWLGDAPVILPYKTLNRFVTLGVLDISLWPLKMQLDKASIEVMAISSPWMSYLVFGAPYPDNAAIPHPFLEDVAYGAIAGDDNNWKVGQDGYRIVHEIQSPTWYPYLSLEGQRGASKNLNDGIVPVWSAIVPGSSEVISANHDGVITNPDAINYTVRWLNRVGLAGGRQLNEKWNTTTEVFSRGGWRWEFSPSMMAPRIQSELYRQIDGIGQIVPDAVKEIRTDTYSNLTFNSVIINWVTALKTTSKVILLKQNGSKFTVAAEVSKLQAEQVHSLIISALEPETTYYYIVYSELIESPNGLLTLTNDRKKVYPDILSLPYFSASQLISSLPSFRTPSPEKVSLSLSLVRGSISVSGEVTSFQIAVKCSAGQVRNFDIVDLNFNDPGFRLIGIEGTPLGLNAGDTKIITLRVTGPLSALSLLTRINYLFQDGAGRKVTGNTAWIRIR